MNAGVLHSLFAFAVLVAYVVLTTLGHDGNVLLGLIGGQAAGIGLDRASGIGKKP